MKIRTQKTQSQMPESGIRYPVSPIPHSACSAFTMVEIAIALGVIAFALVAILQVLPLGMEVQRDNRQDTIINHDGSYLLEAIRHGAEGMDDLTNYFDLISVRGTNYTFGAPSTTTFSTGYDIIALLTTPGMTNVANLRAISGSAAAKGPAMRDFTLRYQVLSQVLAATSVTNIAPTNSYVAELQGNLHEIRLVFRWPLLPNGTLSSTYNSQVFRTTVAGSITTNGFLNTALYR